MKQLFIVVFCFATFAANSMSAFEGMKYRLEDQNIFLGGSICSKLGSENVAGRAMDCKDTALRELKDRYAKTVIGIKKSAAKSAFKSYFVSTLFQINALDVSNGESVGAYNQRQRDAKSRTDEAWLTFEVEMNF